MSVKEHFKKNRKTYLVGMGCLAVGAGAVFLMTTKNAENVIIGPHGSMKWVVKNYNNGHPGFAVQCVETGDAWASQTRAAEALGIDRAKLGEHLNGLREHVNGLHFVRPGHLLESQ